MCTQLNAVPDSLNNGITNDDPMTFKIMQCELGITQHCSALTDHTALTCRSKPVSSCAAPPVSEPPSRRFPICETSWPSQRCWGFWDRCYLQPLKSERTADQKTSLVWPEARERTVIFRSALFLVMWTNTKCFQHISQKHKTRYCEILIEGSLQCQLNQRSPVQIFDFANIFFWRKIDMYSDDSQNIKCNGWMWNPG